MKPRKGPHSAVGFRFGIVVAKFNARITDKLLHACIDTLEAQGLSKKDIEVVRVPGAFEIPLVAQAMARSGRVDAVICVGAVIRGDTPHFDYICSEVSRGKLESISAATRWPKNRPQSSMLRWRVGPSP